MADRDDELLQKADALMRRRRVFVAGTSEAEATAPAAASSAENGEDDVPLLTDIVPPGALEAGTPSSVDVGLLRRTLAEELESWLDNELPSHVQHVLDGITDQMIIQLSRKAREELLPKLEDILSAAREGAKPAPADD